ncbi:MAG: type II toxin-antitoxin system RelB/DinJ family antitoxin [Candidatus Methanomethylophilaceae archaeon]|nr:type II toxin-antitoxin system RelB/DinJ family antitoxin [Candidatus Methanomethylophilaceae archaeon]MBP5395179.1 type II toxin-antitoxin system RelB/DinJ family antitoxin [Candidatus Methanomethylophilaceae archaeon]MBP5735612.1 type II toxin-antitoxin system RelB/DinJ family antitoxin [Candidatus Methanomethylophilaceae archaeon]
MDDELKFNFERTCESFGISMTAAINMFAIAVVNEQCIPFQIRAKPITRDDAWRAFEEASAVARANNPNGMTLDEINKLIAQVRAERG